MWEHISGNVIAGCCNDPERGVSAMSRMVKTGSYILTMIGLSLLLAVLPLFSGERSPWPPTRTGTKPSWTMSTTSWTSRPWMPAPPGRSVPSREGGVILKTTDGGTTWVRQKTITGSWPTQPLSSISVVDANTAWASGYRILLKTTDGRGQLERRLQLDVQLRGRAGRMRGGRRQRLGPIDRRQSDQLYLPRPPRTAGPPGSTSTAVRIPVASSRAYRR